MKSSAFPHLRTPTIMVYPHREWYRSSPLTLRLRRPVWKWQGGMVCLAMGGMLLILGTVLGKIVPPRAEHRIIPQVVQHTRVIIVQDDSLPPVLQRIAQCESRGQHFTRDGQVVRGKQNPHDTGLFQINAVVWGKKARDLGYDIHTREGNEQMARYLFEHYGSVPWQSSATCWNR